MRGETRVRAGDRVLVDVNRGSPVDLESARLRRRLLLLAAGLVLLALAVVAWRLRIDRPERFDDIAEHFKYGSIGSEPGGSILSAVGGLLPPYEILRVLPEMFGDRIPGGWESVGLVVEPGRDRPVGISRRRRLGIDWAGLNCAVCHTGTVRESPGSPRRIVLGMPAHQIDLQRLFTFLLDASLDERFTADNLLGAMRAAGRRTGPLERFVWRRLVIPRYRAQALLLDRRIAPVLRNPRGLWGPGRVDTFNPYKALQFNWPLDALPAGERIGAADFPSIWNQRRREGMRLHWDGDNDSVRERNLSAALGAGVTPVTVDHAGIARVMDWIGSMPSPPYPFAIDGARAARGRPIFQDRCFACHAFGGSRTGTVTPIGEIGTDPHRLNAYTRLFAVNQATLYPDSEWRFTRFRKTNGYANQPLDGVWARAPYLHNGSVPTLRDLLEPQAGRPAVFFRGGDVYDQRKAGFVSDVAGEGHRPYFRFDTAEPGNGNGGHLYGIDLSPEEKDALVEYLKTL